LQGDAPTTHFILKMALRKALKLVRGLRKQVNDIDQDVMTTAIIADLELSGHKIVQEPGRSAGFTFEPPTGPG
jgi:hypothetical protein